MTGSSDPNALITLREGTTVVGTTTANASGTWSVTPTGLPQGSQTITASETDGAGNTSTASVSFTLDSVAPAAPVIVSDKIIGKRVTLSGTADKGSTISVYDGTTLLGTTTVGSNGAWVYQSRNLANGAHVFTATASDVAGNVSALSAPYDPVVGKGATLTAAPIQVGNQIDIYDSSGNGPALSYAGAPWAHGSVWRLDADRGGADRNRL